MAFLDIKTAYDSVANAIWFQKYIKYVISQSNIESMGKFFDFKKASVKVQEK